MEAVKRGAVLFFKKKQKQKRHLMALTKHEKC